MSYITERQSKRAALTIASSAALSTAFHFAGGLGLVLMPAAWTAANIGFKVCDTEGGTYLPLYQDDGSTLVEIASPAADTAYTLPAELAGATWVKLWSQDGAGSDTNQAAERSLTVVHRP